MLDFVKIKRLRLYQTLFGFKKIIVYARLDTKNDLIN